MKKKSIVYLLLFLLVFVGTMPIFYFGGLFIRIVTGPFDKKRVMTERFGSLWFSLLLKSMPTWDIHIEGKEHYNKNKQYMMVINHQSMLDIFVVYTLNIPFKIIAKSKMFKIPFLGWGMKLTDHIGYTPNDIASMQAMMDSVENHINIGNNILVYPEGERTPDGQILPFKEGAFIIAKNKKLPILPMVIKGTKNALPDNVFKGAGHHTIRLKFLEEIPYETFADLKTMDAANLVRDIMVKEYETLNVDSKTFENGVNPNPTPYDKYITLNGVKTYYREYPGEKRDIVLVHGMPSSSYTWNEVIPHLTKAGYHVWCMDLKGFGWSEKPVNSQYDIFVIAEELNTWMEAMGLSNAVVVGHSWGALLTMILAIDHPEKVDELVLIDTVSYPQSAPMIMNLAQLPYAGKLAGLVMQRWLLKSHMKELYFDKKKVTEEKIDAYYNPMCTDNMLNAQVQVIRQLLQKENETYYENYPRIKAKTLIISGANDRWISPEMSHRLQKDIKNSAVAFVPECGHFPQEESPLYTSRLILDFIKDKEAEKPAVVQTPEMNETLECSCCG